MVVCERVVDDDHTKMIHHNHRNNLNKTLKVHILLMALIMTYRRNKANKVINIPKHRWERGPRPNCIISNCN